MKIVTMALRNVGRNKRRSVLAASSVAIAAVLIMVLDGLTSGFLGSMVKNYTKNDVGHFNVETAEYRSRERFMPAGEAMADSGSVVRALREAPALEGKIALVAERIRFGVVLSSEAGSKSAMALAGDPAAERELSMLDRALLPGSAYPAAPGEAILGANLAEDLGLAVGGELKVLAQRADYGLGFKKFRITGIFRSGVSAMDGSLFQVGLEDARDLLGLPGGASQVLVMLKDYRGADAAAAAAGAALEAAGIRGMSVASWTTLGDAYRLVSLAGGVYYIMYLLVFLLGAFIIANIMMMVTLERKREIGILKSMGMRPDRILALFLAEGSLLGAAGAAVGLALGLALNAVLSKVGFDMTSAMAGFDFPLDNVIYPRLDPARTAALFALGVAVSAALSYLPARGAARMECVEAIRSA